MNCARAASWSGILRACFFQYRVWPHARYSRPRNAPRIWLWFLLSPAPIRCCSNSPATLADLVRTCSVDGATPRARQLSTNRRFGTCGCEEQGCCAVCYRTWSRVHVGRVAVFSPSLPIDFCSATFVLRCVLLCTAKRPAMFRGNGYAGFRETTHLNWNFEKRPATNRAISCERCPWFHANCGDCARTLVERHATPAL